MAKSCAPKALHQRELLLHGRDAAKIPREMINAEVLLSRSKSAALSG
jgi:hypothetical protein